MTTQFLHRGQRLGGERFIDPNVLAKIGTLDLIAKSVVHGFISGLHQAPFLGLSTDFAEHRPYMPGDDIRRVDWRVYGRTERLFIKEFQAETNATVTFLLDASRSMSFASHAISKLDYARYLVACLGYLAIKQRDRVGFAAFDDELVSVVPPSIKHFDRVLHALHQLEANAAGDFGAPMTQAARLIARKGIVAVVSDFYADPEELADALGQLRHQGHDVMAFHVLDPEEMRLPEGPLVQFQDMETGARLPVLAEQVTATYAERVKAHCDALESAFGKQGIDYASFNTTDPLDHGLYAYLNRRRHLRKQRTG